MSSDTSVHFTPPPPPPPTIETTVSGGQAVSLNRLFGARGCALLQETFDNLSQPTSSVLEQLTQHLADPAARQAEMSRLRGLFGWKCSETDPSTYSRRVGREALPEEATRLGVQSLEIHVRIGASVLETRFEHTLLSTTGLEEGQRYRLAEALQRTSNRAVNQVLAVAVQQRLSEKLRQHLDLRLRQTVQNRVANQYTLRTYAYANVNF